MVKFYVVQYVCNSHVSCKYGHHMKGEKIPQLKAVKKPFWSKALSLVMCYLTLSLTNGMVLLMN